MQPGRREHRHWAIGLGHQQLDLGAAKNDALGPGRGQPGDDLPVPVTGGIQDDALAELVVDDRVDRGAVLEVGDQDSEPM